MWVFTWLELEIKMVGSNKILVCTYGTFRYVYKNKIYLNAKLGPIYRKVWIYTLLPKI